MKDMGNRCFRFDNVEINVQNLRVTDGSEIRSLEPKSFRLLLFLVENPGRALPKEEIMGVVWPGTFVSDNSLARAITQIRKALDDDPKSPRYIETIPTVGYRFLEKCTTDLGPPTASEALEGDPEPTAASTPAAVPAQARPHSGATIAIVAVLVIAIAAGLWLLAFPKAQALTNRDTIVLADFANSTGDTVFDEALKQGLAVQIGRAS